MRRTAESAVFTNCGVPLTVGLPSLNTPLAAHAYIRRSTMLASLPMAAAMPAAVCEPWASRSGISNFSARCMRIV